MFEALVVVSALIVSSYLVAKVGARTGTVLEPSALNRRGCTGLWCAIDSPIARE